MAGCPRLEQTEVERGKGNQMLKTFLFPEVKENRVYCITKRIFDVNVALFILLLVLPLIPVIIILIKIDTKGSLFYKQKRVGKDSKEFDLYKFRSMVKGADKTVESLRQLSDSDGPIFKLKNDPRITKFGRLLRNLTIDEFPQIYNVFKGQMSIVGPRAYLKKEIQEQTKKYPKTKKWIKSILSVKPGITGAWQTSGRNVVPFAKRAKMDYDYIRNLSFWRDLKIILKTPRAMISKW